MAVKTNSEQSQQIIKRFAAALDIVIKKGKYASLYDFAASNGFARGSIYKTMSDPSSKAFQIDWLQPLVTNHGLDANWVITGKGKAFPVTK